MYRKRIEEAHDRIRTYIFNTPVLQNVTIDALAGCQVLFKCENLQKIGAFKARGALNAALNLPKESLVNGLCTHSSGNHAQAIALAAMELSVPAYIVMPQNAPAVKKEGVYALDAEVTLCEPTLEARVAEANKIIDQTGATFIHPFDNDDVICGQATVAKEIIEAGIRPDFILAPVGGGGLLSGTSLSVHYFLPACKVIGCEPEGAADAILSFKSGQVEAAPYINTIADGLLTNLSERTLGIIKEHVSDILLANDEEIVEAMLLIIKHLKVVVEPSASLALACVLKNKARFHQKQVCIILSGGNVDLKDYIKD